jgi:hypothetical protein
MNIRRIIPVVLLIVAGVLSLSVSLDGALSLIPGAHSAGAGLHLLYAIPLVLLFPFFCLTFFHPRLSVALQFADGCVFLAATLIVNMHDCGNSQPCAGFLHVAIASVLQHTTMVPFVIAALQALSMSMRNPHPVAYSVHRSI